MKPNEYQEEALKFASDVSIATPENLLLQGVMGLCGETGEVCEAVLNTDDVNKREHVLKELGDVLWYISTTASALGVSLSDVILRSYNTKYIDYHFSESLYLMGIAVSIQSYAGKAIDVVKKLTFHGHELNPENRNIIVNAISSVFAFFNSLCVWYGFTLEEVMEENISKLSKRYPNGHFESERSIHREEGDI